MWRGPESGGPRKQGHRPKAEPARLDAADHAVLVGDVVVLVDREALGVRPGRPRDHLRLALLVGAEHHDEDKKEGDRDGEEGEKKEREIPYDRAHGGGGEERYEEVERAFQPPADGRACRPSEGNLAVLHQFVDVADELRPDLPRARVREHVTVAVDVADEGVAQLRLLVRLAHRAAAPVGVTGDRPHFVAAHPLEEIGTPTKVCTVGKDLLYPLFCDWMAREFAQVLLARPVAFADEREPHRV